MARIVRGEMRWADLSSTPGKGRASVSPVLIVSEDVFNQYSGTVIAMAITSRPPTAGFPLTLELASKRLQRRSWVKISQIRTFARERLGKRIDRASSSELAQVMEGLREILGS